MAMLTLDRRLSLKHCLRRWVKFLIVMTGVVTKMWFIVYCKCAHFEIALAKQLGLCLHRFTDVCVALSSIVE